jgi:hypothetical protein
MSRSQIEERYGVPLPIDVLWRELEQSLGSVEIARLKYAYRQATRRYSRAANLNKWRRLIARLDRGDTGWRLRPEREKAWREALADPQKYIDQAPDDEVTL